MDDPSGLVWVRWTFSNKTKLYLQSESGTNNTFGQNVVGSLSIPMVDLG